MSVTGPDFVSRGEGHPDQPNIIFIVADDLGWADLGCYGSDHISTPNLDRLAADGLRLTHAYSASPWCSPMRFALYTGRSPGRLVGGLEEPLVAHTEQNGIPQEHPTLPSMLVEAGYRTAMIGKWHCGWLPWFSPVKNGFQTFFGNLDGAVDYFGYFNTIGETDLWEGEERVEATGYYTDILSERAAAYVAEAGADPFYLQLNYTAPHWPWEGRDDEHVSREIKQLYDDGAERWPILHWDGGSIAKYAEMVEIMDEGIGQVLDALDASGRADNTIVLFCSDNGGERWSKNWPFVGEKGDITEGGIRVPFIVRWPAALDGGQVSDRPVTTVDWTATLLQAGGAAPHQDYPLDGVSLVPWLCEGTEFPEHDLFWRVASQAAIRRGRFKYIQSGRPRARLGNWPVVPGEYEMLYDVTVDGREAADIIRHHPEVVEELRTALDAMNAELLPYPADHRGLPPQRATATQPAVSQPD